MIVKRIRGQSLIEVIFSIGIIMVVISGVVFLILATLGSKTKGYDRKVAVEISQMAIEEMVKVRRDAAYNFWDLSSTYWQQQAQNHINGDYNYVVSVTQYVGNGCSAVPVECINTKVTISWKGKDMETFNRFFSK